MNRVSVMSVGLAMGLSGGLLAPVSAVGRGFVTSAQADLNGDGKRESVSLHGITERGEFVLRVGQAAVRGRLGYKSDGFIIVDLNTHDKFKEIAVHTGGPSADFEYMLYWYDGKSIKAMGHLQGSPTFTGYGIVYVKRWEHCFWWKTEKYVLDQKRRILRVMPQEFYYVGVEATVSKSFPIYHSRQGEYVIAHLRLKSKALILLNRHDWYLVKSSTGLVGWTKAVYTSFSDLPLAD